jgi:hypothetical protein
VILDSIAAVLIVIAVALLAVAGVLAVAKLRFIRRAARTTGTVTALRAEGPTDGGGNAQMLRPVIRFTPPQGAGQGGEIEFALAAASTPPRYRIGDSVPVRYDPLNPAATARIDSLRGLWLAPALYGGLAVPALIVAVGLSLWHAQTARGLAELRRTGMPVTGVVAQIDLDQLRTGADGKPLYVLSIEAEEPGTRRRLTFTSEAIEADLREDYTIGDKVRVFIDPTDPARYLVDLR